jgi:hypothetical protein
MIGSKIKIEIDSTTVHGGKKTIEVKVIDKVRTASLVADNNGNGLAVQQDCYICMDVENKVHIIVPIQIKEVVQIQYI